LIVLSKTHAWGSVFAARPYEGPFGAHTCASIFVFADNDVFSDPSWCLVSAWGGGRKAG
jgi:hypothetical protein